MKTSSLTRSTQTLIPNCSLPISGRSTNWHDRQRSWRTLGTNLAVHPHRINIYLLQELGGRETTRVDGGLGKRFKTRATKIRNGVRLYYLGYPLYRVYAPFTTADSRRH